MAKKKNNDFMSKYKTHDGDRGSTETWTEGLSQLLNGETQEEQDKKKEKIEEKLVKVGKRRLQLD